MTTTATQDNIRPLAPPLPDGSVNQNPTGIGFWSLVAEDFETHGREWFNQGFWTLYWHRFGNWRMSIKSKLLRAPFTIIYRIMFKASEIFCGIKLSYPVIVGRRVKFEHFGGMIIGARSIGDDVIIRQNTTMGVLTKSDLNAKPIIGNRVDIGAGACLLGHTTVNDDAIIGANAVVTKDVPAGAIVGGVPAKLIRMRSDLTD